MAKREGKEKNNWKKKRRQEYLEKKEFRYYIFCEGQATEPNYFQGFKRYIEDNPIYRDMVLIEIEGCQAETMRVIGKAEECMYVRIRLRKGRYGVFMIKTVSRPAMLMEWSSGQIC